MTKRVLRAVVRLAQGIYHHEDIFHAAPAMAFHFFLSLLPLLVFIGYVLGLVAQREGASAVIGMVLDNLPATTEAVLKDEVGRLAAADRLGPLAAVGFLWIASSGIQGLMQAIERVVGAPRRAWWKQRLIALAWVFGTMAACGVASYGIIRWEEVVHPATESLGNEATTADPMAAPRSPSVALADPTTRREPARRVRRILRIGGDRVLTVGTSLLAAVAALAAFYHFAVAHSREVRRRVLPGALLAMALVIVVSWGFSVYVRTLASYAVYYGGLAAIAVTIVWLWLLSLAILVGAELNSQLEGLRD